MPFKSKEQHNEWRRKVYRERREEYFSDKFCIDCGSSIILELDHIDPKTKISHRIWFWKKEKREKELAKCVVRCKSCHKNRHRKIGKWKEAEAGSKPIQVESSGRSVQNLTTSA